MHGKMREPAARVCILSHTAMTEPTPSPLEGSPAEAARATVNRKAGWVAALVGVFFVLVLGGVVFVLTLDPARTANLRDITIILLMVSLIVINLVVGVLLVVVLFRLQEMISFLRGELAPLLRDATQTVHTVRGTATFVSDHVARPIIRAAAWVAGAQQFARSLTQRARRWRGR